MAAYKVLVATVLINCLVKGTLKSLGVLMLELDGLGVDTRTASSSPSSPHLSPSGCQLWLSRVSVE